MPEDNHLHKRRYSYLL